MFFTTIIDCDNIIDPSNTKPSVDRLLGPVILFSKLIKRFYNALILNELCSTISTQNFQDDLIDVSAVTESLSHSCFRIRVQIIALHLADASVESSQLDCVF